ncbi:MAG: hypothetical protein L3K17_08950 [Thermoplasmata archaeon]|nr:hypothetical protein [Thermoplasmata archaeon]
MDCARCHLSASLFDVVREAAGESPESNPRYEETIGEILSQLGDGPGTPEPSASAQVSHAHRFPSAADGSGTGAASSEPAAPTLGGLPALPPAGDLPVLLRQVNDYLALGRRQGLDLSAFTARTHEAMASQDRATVESLSRDLFIFLAASLTDEYESAIGRRHELAGLIPTATLDVELEGCRSALGLGDVAGAQRRLRHVEQALSDLEDQWATVQILVTESDLLAKTIQDLGGDPRPALGPLAEGQRRARAGDRPGAEPVLARATLALWLLLNPLFQKELARLKERLLVRRAEGADVGPAVGQLRHLAADLRHRNFASAVLTYRTLRDLVDGVVTAVPSPTGAGPAPPRG